MPKVSGCDQIRLTCSLIAHPVPTLGPQGCGRGARCVHPDRSPDDTAEHPCTTISPISIEQPPDLLGKWVVGPRQTHGRRLTGRRPRDVHRPIIRQLHDGYRSTNRTRGRQPGTPPGRTRGPTSGIPAGSTGDHCSSSPAWPVCCASCWQWHRAATPRPRRPLLQWPPLLRPLRSPSTQQTLQRQRWVPLAP